MTFVNKNICFFIKVVFSIFANLSEDWKTSQKEGESVLCKQKGAVAKWNSFCDSPIKGV